jgi:hypothetical protein
MTLPLQEFSVLKCGQRIPTGRTRPQQKSDCRRREKEEGWKEGNPLTPEELGREYEFISLPAFKSPFKDWDKWLISVITV